LDKAVALRPHEACIYHNRASAHYTLGRYDEAWADVHKAESLGLTIDPELLQDLREASGRDE